MSQNENKIEWCLRKAEHELEEGNKHRGLRIIGPDLSKAKKHLEKAEHNLKAIFYFEKGNFQDWCFSAGFYSIYHCFLAILAKKGYESRNQECTIAVIEMLLNRNEIDFDKDIIESFKSGNGNPDQKIIALREEYQYGMEIDVAEKAKIQKIIQQSKGAIEFAKRIVLDK